MLIVAQLVKTFSTFYGTQRFITAFTRLPPLVRILSQMKSHLNFRKFHSNIILPPTPTSSVRSLPFRFPNQTIVSISHVFHARYISSSFHPPWHDHPNDTWWCVQVMKLVCDVTPWTTRRHVTEDHDLNLHRREDLASHNDIFNWFVLFSHAYMFLQKLGRNTGSLHWLSYLTDVPSMEQSPSWDARSHSDNEEIFHILWNPQCRRYWMLLCRSPRPNVILHPRTYFICLRSLYFYSAVTITTCVRGNAGLHFLRQS
jgi:hypothetical protein